MVPPRTYTYIQAKRLCESLTGLARNRIESPSMNKEQSSHRLTADDVYEEVANAVVTYMVECGLKDSDVIAGEFFSALAHAYKPLPRFWRDFKLQPVINAVSTQYPQWSSVALRRDRNAKNVVRIVEKFLKRSAFDEANAEMLMALPPQDRPATADDALDWICERFIAEGHYSKLRFAQWIGLDCGGQALEVMRGLELAAAGIEYSSPCASFARQIRDQCIAKRRAALSLA